MRRKRAFTLLEVLVAICLLTLIAGALGWKLHGMIARKRFTSGIERLRSRLLTCRRLALNMQADWRGVLQWNGETWVFEAVCVESPKMPGLSPLSIDSLTIFLDGEKKEFLAFDFTASGDVFPKGILTIAPKTGESDKIEWKFPDLFLLEEGEKLGPVHPDEVK